MEYGNLRDYEGQYEQALAAYDSALRIDPEDADVWYNKGENLNKMGRHAELRNALQPQSISIADNDNIHIFDINASGE